MKNVLFITHFFYPHTGGVEKPLGKIIPILDSKGYKITVVTEKYDSSLKGFEIKNRVKIIRFEYPKKKFLGLFYIWLWFFQNMNLIRKSDIIHCHDVFIWYLPFRFIFLRKRVYTTFHGWEGVYPIPLKNILLKRLAWKLSDRSICVGRFIESYYGIRADFVTYGAVDHPERLQKKRKNTILYVGRLEKDTGLLILLRSLSLLKNLDLNVTFCGDGPLRNECLKFGKVCGFVDPKPFQKKSLVCFASGYFSIIEALANKCVVVAAYENPLKRDYFKISPFKKWVILEAEEKKLSQRISDVFIHPKKYRKQIKEAYSWALSQNWEKLADLYVDLWDFNK